MPRFLREFVIVLMCVVGMNGRGMAQEAVWPAQTYYRMQEVNGLPIFYREAGENKEGEPTLILLHGYPASSHQYRELITLLSGRYHIIAPDNLGSGHSAHPDPDTFTYTFDALAEYTTGLIKALGIKEYVVYMQDFGAPVGYRVIMAAPGKLAGLIVQNANAYLEGMTQEKIDFFKNAQQDKSPENVAKLYQHAGAQAVKSKQYLRDVAGKEEIMSPDTWTYDSAFLQTDKDRKIQVRLFQDYYTNLLSYPDWQAWLKEHQPPTLIVWGAKDPVFMASGAKAYLRDVPDAELHLLDAGHFALEEKPVEIAQHIIQFMDRLSENRNVKSQKKE